MPVNMQQVHAATEAFAAGCDVAVPREGPRVSVTPGGVSVWSGHECVEFTVDQLGPLAAILLGAETAIEMRDRREMGRDAA